MNMSNYLEGGRGSVGNDSAMRLMMSEYGIQAANDGRKMHFQTRGGRVSPAIEIENESRQLDWLEGFATGVDETKEGK